MSTNKRIRYLGLNMSYSQETKYCYDIYLITKKYHSIIINVADIKIFIQGGLSAALYSNFTGLK